MGGRPIAGLIMDKDKQMKYLLDWVEDRFRSGDVPRFADVVEYAHQVLGFRQLKKSEIVKQLRLMDVYLMSSKQKRKTLRSGKNRPIIMNNLGNLHCDIGFYSVKREYETPVTYRSGFLVAKDVLSRMVYVSILYKTRTAESMVKAFRDILDQFKQHNNGEPVVSVAFDKERSVLSNLVQNFFREHHIKFHAFQMSDSKSKHAESAISLLRTVVVRLQTLPQFENRRWWTLLHLAADILNRQMIRVKGKSLGYTPQQVKSSNLKDFLQILYKKVPAYYWSQFDIAPQLVKFAFAVGDVVRPKLIAISSAVIGIKRSEVTLSETRYTIQKQIPYVSGAFTIERAYECKSLVDDSTEFFDESDIALSK